MEEKDANFLWDVVQDIVQKDIGKVCRMYEKNETKGTIALFLKSLQKCCLLLGPRMGKII
jgi:hypothetical protein